MAEPEPSAPVEVLIAGGGPCGLMLAIELGRRGVRTLLVDEKPSTAFNPQANATQARTMEHYRRLGMAGEIRALGLPRDYPTDIAYFTRFARHELARFSLPSAAQATAVARTLSGSWSAAELPHRVSQKFVEQVLRRHAERQSSVTVRFATRLTAFTDHGDRVTATLQSLDTGASRQLEALWLVGADGARSPVRRALGIGWSGATRVERDFMGGRMCAVYLSAPELARVVPHAPAWMHVTVNQDRRAFMAAVDGAGELAFHTQLRPGESEAAIGPREALAFFHAAVGLELPATVLSHGFWTAGHALVAERFGHGRALIGGDAAHLFTPAGGLGYNTAVEDAVNLGWKLAATLRGAGGPGLVASYGAERRPLAVRNTGYAGRFADSLGGYVAPPELEDDTPEGAAARAEAGRYFHAHARAEFDIPGITFGGRYDGSPLIAADGTLPPADAPNRYQPTACPGGRPPHLWLADGRSLFDSFGPEWTLLRLGAGGTEATAIVEAARSAGADLTVREIAEPAARDLYEADLALIRPDQIVAWRGDRPPADAAQLWRRLLGW